MTNSEISTGHLTGAQQHARAVSLAQFQGGILSRQQLKSAGFSDAAIQRQVAGGRWQALLRATYAIFTGDVPVESWWWASFLAAGQDSSLCAESALQAWGLRKAELPVLLAVRHGTHFAERRGVLVVRRFREPRPAVEPKHLPPASLPEHAVLDAADGCESVTGVIDLISSSIQKRVCTAERLNRALEQRTRFRHRNLVGKVLAQLADGATNQLEADGVWLIFRSHGLPPGLGQQREFQNGAHVIRFGWHDVHEAACEAAVDVARVFARNGWTGCLHACGHTCRAIAA